MVHEKKASRLHGDLGNAEQAGSAREAVIDGTAKDVGSTCGECQDVGERTRSCCGAEQDEVGRDADRGAPRHDTPMLREVGDDDANEQDER